MVTMDDISNAIILLVRVGAVARFIYCLVRLTAAEEQAAQYKKRARNTVIFYIIAESIWQIKDMILYYFLSLILAVLTGVMLFGVRRQDFSSIRLPLAPFFCIGGVTAYWLAAAAAVI